MTAPKLLPCPFCGSEAEMLGGPMAQDCYDVWCKSKQVRHHLRGTMDPVKTAERWNARALATPDQIAALAAERAATVTVKPLVWVKDTMPNAAPQRYRAATHDGSGDYSVSGSKNSDSWQWFRNGYFVDGHQHHKPMPLDAAKSAAQADYDARIRAAITIASGASPGTITLPRAVVEALIETITIQCGLLTMGCGGVQHRIDITVARMIKALATLQERMK